MGNKASRNSARLEFSASLAEIASNIGTTVLSTRNIPISQNDTDFVMNVISDRIAREHENFKPLTSHTLRHTFATRCIERGMNPKNSAGYFRTFKKKIPQLTFQKQMLNREKKVA